MAIDKIHDYTDAYLESYLRALDKTHNPDLARRERSSMSSTTYTTDIRSQSRCRNQRRKYPS